MAKALWVFLVTGEFGIPTVYKPSETIRTLRRLFATYNLLNRQIRMLKNAIQAMLLDDGIVLTTSERSRLFTGRESVADMIGDRSLSPPIRSVIEIQVDLQRRLSESKDALAERIVVASAPLAEQIKLLVTIPGITPLTAAAFLADVGDVRRSKSLRRMNAYLGLVPRCHDSGGKSPPFPPLPLRYHTGAANVKGWIAELRSRSITSPHCAPRARSSCVPWSL